MSILQPKPIYATVEVLYSDVRIRDMKKKNQTTCTLIINIIKHIFARRGIRLEEISVPKNKKHRIADIYFEVIFNSDEEIEEVEKEIHDKTVGNLKSVKTFVRM